MILDQINAKIESAGGSAFLVGGAVIDRIAGRESKDFDVEVFGVGFDRLAEIFSAFNPNLVGQAFGILKIVVDGFDIDLSIPRRENRVGIGHKAFDVTPDPTMTIREAARRRDFSINSISVDLSTGEVVDPFGGLSDLEAGILRATDPETFIEDPLRAFRAMQLLARKAKMIDASTMILIRGMFDDCASLPKERIHEEFRKLLLKAERPSVGLQFLRESGLIAHFPELEAMIGCEQNAEWHPEGDVWIHACQAADAAASIRHLIDEDRREAFCFGAWLHDIGKPATTVTQDQIDAGLFTQDRLLTAHGHDLAGMDPAETFMRRLTGDNRMIERIRTLVGLHMQPFGLVSGNAGRGAWIRIARALDASGLDLRILGRLCQCDACATGSGRSISHEGITSWEHRSSEACFRAAEMIEENRTLMAPLVMGRHLIAAGMTPGPRFGEILSLALEMQLSNTEMTREEILTAILSP